MNPRHLFLQRTGNRQGDKPYPSGTYTWILREFSKIVKISDSKGRPVGLSHTHRFRHTKLTRLAALGLPVHVLMRYAGHATPSMTMHYIAARHEHAEQAFLATAKLKAYGTRVVFSREDHDSLHLFNRADRFLPHGWCLLPPLQTCDKGNACLTCSVFVTDASHQTALKRQLAETQALIDRATTAFQQRHGHPMPEDNVWLRPGHQVQIDVKFVEPLPTAKPAGQPVPKPIGRRGKFYQFTAIDDCTRPRIMKIYPKLNQKTAIQFLDYLLSQLPFAVDTIQTDNGAEFASMFHWHVLDKGIRHVYIKPRTPDSTARSSAATASTPRSSAACSTASSSTTSTSSTPDSKTGRTTTTTTGPTAASTAKPPMKDSARRPKLEARV